MIGNILRRLRRDKSPDDATMAYIESRSGNPSAGTVGSADVESLRATVALLRSVAPAKAPRSFALTAAQAAARPTSRPYSAPWYTRAPALGAAAAVFTLAFLLIGDIAGGLRQSEAPAAQVQGEAAQSKSVGGTEAISDASMARPDATSMLESAVQPASLSSEQRSALPAATATSTAAVPELGPGTPVTAPARALTGITTPSPAVPSGDTPVAETGMDILSTDGETVAVPALGPTEQVEGGSVELVNPDLLATQSPELFETASPASIDSVSGEALVEVATGEAKGLARTATSSDQSGFALPLWQLEVALGIAAAAFAVAWAAMRRSRRSAP